MKEINTKKLSERLSKYSTLSLAISSVAISNGQSIIYHDVNPDVGGVGVYFDINIDNNGDPEFRVGQHNSYYKSLYARIVNPGSHPNNAIFGYQYSFYSSSYGYIVNKYPFALSAGVTISNSAFGSASNKGGAGVWMNTNDEFLNDNNCNYYYSNFCADSGDKYLALKFDMGGQVYYGWARIYIGSTSTDWKIKDYAYIDTPNTPINAGQTTLGIKDASMSKVEIISSNKKIKLFNLPEPIQYQVFSMTGQSVLKGTTSGKNDIIDATPESEGVYFIELNDTESNSVLRKKIVL